MANPAPTINQINAFNATQGTIIDFNIIGGTELVRSNRIYIYDLSDNSLICTHLYVSTESIHELPANTDSSIIYESGKSSADFVNGAQYYAQIQTFTDIAGTEGGSGLSVAKMFWCLVDPTLTIDAIPSTISTTSYNVSATYNANTSVVSNIIQQYQFNLYNAIGSLLQSSGVIVGNGEQQGTGTLYDISYNFTGLSVGSSYYVTVEVTTTQGMSINTQSNTFTISIDTPTLGEATVVNNACDGYISVTSNLSSEYGGSGSGEIVSFETDSENVFTKLQVDLDPIQDLHGYDAPWVGGAGVNLLDENYSTRYTNEVELSAGTYYAQAFLITSVSKTNSRLEVYANGSWQKILNTPFSVDDGNFLSEDNTFGWMYNTVTNTITISSGTYKVRFETNNTVRAQRHLSISKTRQTSWTPYENICPISGWDEVETHKAGKNLVDVADENGSFNSYYKEFSTQYKLVAGQTYTLSATVNSSETPFYFNIGAGTETGGYIYDISTNGGKTNGRVSVTFTPTETQLSGHEYLKFRLPAYATSAERTYSVSDIQFELGSTATDYEPYQGHTYTTDLPQTVYGGTLDVVSGVLTVDRAMVDLGSLTWVYEAYYNRMSAKDLIGIMKVPLPNETNAYCSSYAVVDSNYGWSHRNDETTLAIDPSEYIRVYNTSYTSASDFKSAMNGVQLVYTLATPTTIQCDPQTVQTLIGDNNVWGDGSVSITYNIPITNLLVKRQDVADVSGTWLTLYSQPITQASDMDFTFIDFLNQYGKTYKYALVPLLTQTQSGVEVEVEGGYTVSDEVQSIFDGVFIADQTGLQKCKANVGYGDVDMNQSVGTITPIGAKYPVVITNSKNQYHNGSISGTIVPDDYYFNGNLSRIDMVNKRNELEQFLTNKRAKIIKDWNSNIWLVMIIDNINCSFDNNYGMGVVNFNASWIEVGDPTNQQDLQAAGLIDVGGV